MVVAMLFVAMLITCYAYDHDPEQGSDTGVLGETVSDNGNGETYRMTGQILIKDFYYENGEWDYLPNGKNGVLIFYTLNGKDMRVYTEYCEQYVEGMKTAGVYTVEGIPHGSTIVITNIYLCYYISGVYVECPIYDGQYIFETNVEDYVQTAFSNITGDITVSTIYMDLVAWSAAADYPCRCDEHYGFHGLGDDGDGLAVEIILAAVIVSAVVIGIIAFRMRS